MNLTMRESNEKEIHFTTEEELCEANMNEERKRVLLFA